MTPIRVLPPLILAALVIAFWQVAAQTGFLADTLGLDPLLVPSPPRSRPRSSMTG